MAEEENTAPKTLNESNTYFSAAKSHVKRWHDNIDRWRDWYDFKHYKGRSLPYEERFPDPTPTNVVDLAVGVILGNEIEWRAQGWEPHLGEEEDSSRIEKFLAGTIYVNSERNEYHIPYELIFNFVRDGAGVLYTVWDPEIEKRAVKEQPDGSTVLEELPLRVQVIDPDQIYVLPGGPNRWGHVFREWEMSVWDVEHTWGKKVKQYNHLNKRQKMTTKIKVRDYWRMMFKKKTKTEVEVELNDDGEPETKETQVTTTERVVENAVTVEGGTVIFPLREMEGYDDIAYTIGFFKPIDRDDSKGWHGIIRPIESSIHMLEKAINRRSRQLLVYSSLPFIARTLPQRQVNLDPALGNLVELGVEESLEFPSWPGNAPDVEQQIGYFRSRLQQAGFSDVTFGMGPSQVSGFALSQLGDQNRIRLTQPIQHLEMMLNQWARKVLRLVENFTDENTKIRVYGSLKGQDFIQQIVSGELSQYMVQANIEPEFPNEKVRKHAMRTQVADLLSESTQMEEYLDIKQPDDERKKKLREQLQMNPIMQQYKIMQWLMQRAETDEAAALMLAQMVQGGGPQNQGGRPPEGRNPEQPMGLQSPNGQQAADAEGRPPGQEFQDELERAAGNSPQLTGGQPF